MPDLLLWRVLCCCTASIVDTDGNPFASPRVEVVSDSVLVRKITFRPEQSGSTRIVERLQSWQRVGGARTSTLGVPAVAELMKPGDPLWVQVEPVVPIP